LHTEVVSRAISQTYVPIRSNLQIEQKRSLAFSHGLRRKARAQRETPHLGRHGGFHGDLLPFILRLRVPNPHAYPVGAARRRVPRVQPRRCGVPRGGATAALAVASEEVGVRGQWHPLRRRVGPLRRGAQLRPRGGGGGGRGG
jgi:hypothetical protein